MLNSVAPSSWNIPAPFTEVNLFDTDQPLREAVARNGVDPALEGLPGHGALMGSAHMLEMGRLANANPPVLHTHDARGERADVVEFHPAYHALMRAGMAVGLHASTFQGGSATARAARLYMTYQTEAGHVCPLTMTHASLAALRGDWDASRDWASKIGGRAYDPAFRPWWEKSAVTIGMGMTEKQGGADVRANVTQAAPHGDAYEIDGHKWFMSAPMCDAFLVLAQAPGGLTCFLAPRFRPDGSVNGLRFVRLKDKLGNRSNASSEVEFVAAYAQRIGDEGAGVRTILAMVHLTRLDCAVASAGLMRFGLAYALHYARRREAFGALLSEQPLMRATLADLALESEASTALAMRLAGAFDHADEEEQAFARLMTPAAKHHVCKAAPAFLHEAMECLGGNGYIEDWPLARAYREAPVNAIWEGSGNIMALDVLRAASRAPDAAAAVIERLGQAADARGLAGDLIASLRAEDAPSRARSITERLAKLGAAAALAAGDGAVAQAYRATRLDEQAGVWGAADLRRIESHLLERAFPE
ncbi:MAG: isovaleryl-CoA dehydrogenase [Hyphomicrobiales bacterium]|nr:isovaleryl-CoA dehydrogenase [Hyphomicrobiales bacterium]